MNRIVATVSSPVLGIPVPDSENPFIAVPVGKVELSISRSDSCRAGVPKLSSMIEGFLDNLFKGLELGYCVDVEVIGKPDVLPEVGVYAAITASTLYWISKEHGESLTPLEIVEMARLSDPISYDRSWQPAIDSARISSASGEAVVYRNEEEYASFGAISLEAVFSDTVDVKPRVSRDTIGGDAYNALVHLAGVMVLEAAVRLREGGSLDSIIHDTKPIQDGIAAGVWGVNLPGDGCIWTPGMPLRLSKMCFARLGWRRG